MAAGFRSLFAPWLGGASSQAPTTTAGLRGLFAPWLGGASSPTVASSSGFRGLLAFWAGGASAGEAAPETPVDEGGGWQPFHAYYQRRRIEELRQVKAKLQELEVVAQETFVPAVQTNTRKTIRSARQLRELDAERLRLQMHIALLEERFSAADARRISDEDDATALILMAAVA